jgi:phage shock protein PspC (stress-responsive transcriptional regulator)
MNTVTTINLAGTAFQVEDPGFAALKSYLDDARRSLAGNPDETEIISDIERAIAEKCRRFVSAHKNVITTAEAEAIVAEMGPVSGETAEQEAASKKAQKPKRLYRIVEGEMVAGVANGLAAYFDIDVVLMRILFILLLVVTGGGFAFAYVLGWVFIPAAETAEQVAAASGAPFNAQEIVDRVKAEYARFEKRHGREWRREWKEWKRNLAREHEEHKRWEREAAKWRAYQYRGPSAFGELLGITVFLFFAWYGYHHFPALHDFMDAAWNFLNRVVDIITNAIANN